jgi:hypothetical protein
MRFFDFLRFIFNEDKFQEWIHLGKNPERLTIVDINNFDLELKKYNLPINYVRFIQEMTQRQFLRIQFPFSESITIDVWQHPVISFRKIRRYFGEFLIDTIEPKRLPTFSPRKSKAFEPQKFKKAKIEDSGSNDDRETPPCVIDLDSSFRPIEESSKTQRISDRYITLQKITFSHHPGF